MDPDMINCMILRIHVENKIILSHAILRQTSVSARYGSKKKSLNDLAAWMTKTMWWLQCSTHVDGTECNLSKLTANYLATSICYTKMFCKHNSNFSLYFYLQLEFSAEKCLFDRNQERPHGASDLCHCQRSSLSLPGILQH